MTSLMVDRLLDLVRAERPVTRWRHEQFVQHKGDDSDEKDTDAKPVVPTRDYRYQEEHPQFA
jgi:hypothetical protein